MSDIAVDIKLRENSIGQYDITIADNGDFDLESGFDTALINSVLTERRADPSEIQESIERRGWWGDVASVEQGFQEGSKLWLLYQSRNTQETVNRAEDYVRGGLQWLLNDNLIDEVFVEGQRTFDTVNVNVTLVRNNDPVTSATFNIWNNTGVN